MAEPTLLYEYNDFFRITTMGGTYYVREPLDWDKVRIKLSRDENYWGFNYEFVDDTVKLRFPRKNGYEVLRGVHGLQGGDGQAKFEYGYEYLGQRYVQFVGNINFNE